MSGCCRGVCVCARVLLGGWGGAQPGQVGERDMGDARLPWYELCLGWFGHWLHGEPLPSMPKVLYYTMGSNRWQTATAWPLPNAEPTEYYLHSGEMGANSRNGDGLLSTLPPPPATALDSGGSLDAFVYDPARPVPSVGGQRGVGDSMAGPVDQARVELRNDVLCYTTPPLEQGVEVSTMLCSRHSPRTGFKRLC